MKKYGTRTLYWQGYSDGARKIKKKCGIFCKKQCEYKRGWQDGDYDRRHNLVEPYGMQDGAFKCNEMVQKQK